MCDKNIIANHVKDELLNLPHQVGIKDCLPETDNEDERVDEENQDTQPIQTREKRSKRQK